MMTAKSAKSCSWLICLIGLAVSALAQARGHGGGLGGGHWGGGHYWGGGGRYWGGAPRWGGGYRGGWYGRGFRGYSNFGVYVGPGWGWGWPYYPYYPYYYAYPPVIATVPASPPVYIQQPDAQAAPPPPNFWNYCADPEGYSPYVKECPPGWQRVPQVPPGQETGYWYNCDHPPGYYPYVRECAGNWKKVIPEQ